MSDLSYGYPPEPLSCYKDHNRYDYYYKREDRPAKKGQPWDLFNAWGHRRLLLDKKDGVTKATSTSLAMNYKASSCTIPTMPPNDVIDNDYINPTLQPLQAQRELSRMKEAILYRIPMAKHKGKNYGKEVKSVQRVAKGLLKQTRANTELSQVLSSSSDEEDESLIDSGKKRPKGITPEFVDESDSELEEIPEDNAALLTENIQQFTQDNPLVKRVLCDFHNDPRLFSEVRVPMLATDYLGGCLSCTQTESKSYIAHASGTQMSRVLLKQVEGGDVYTEMTDVGIYDNTEGVRQVELQGYGSDLWFAVRSGSRMSICNTEADEITAADVVQSSNIRHVSMSPYFPEALYVQDHCIYRWSGSGQSEQLFTDWSTRFPVCDATETVHYACHPRQLVMTDPTVCSLYDTRSRTTLELFEVPSNTLLHEDERLVTSVQAKDFTHHILAHHTLISVDERFAKYPVLYQVLPCLTWPMLIDSLRLDSTTDLLLTACPTNQETFALVLETSHSILRSTPVWKCSQPSDICHLNETKPLISDRLFMDNRLNSGLLGLSASRLRSDGFTVHMLSGNGDLFEQTYKSGIDSDLDDRTKAAGPVIERTPSTPDVTARCKAWYDVVVSQLSDDSKEEVIGPTLVIPKDNLLPAHQSCSVCNGKSVDANSTEDSFQCLACGLLLEQSEQFIENHKHGKYYGFDAEGYTDPLSLTDFDPQEKAGSDPNSNLLIKLWHGEDFKEDLTERNKEWDERREKMTRQDELDGTLASSELGALSSLSGTSKRTKSVGAQSSMSISSYGRNRKSVPGFGSPRTRFMGGSDAGSRHGGGGDMLSPPLFSSLWMGDSSLQQSASKATPSSQRKSRGKQTKGF